MVAWEWVFLSFACTSSELPWLPDECYPSQQLRVPSFLRSPLARPSVPPRKGASELLALGWILQVSCGCQAWKLIAQGTHLPREATAQNGSAYAPAHGEAGPLEGVEGLALPAPGAHGLPGQDMHAHP